MVPKCCEITAEQFLYNYLIPEKPIIITDAMHNWTVRSTLSLSQLRERFGSYRVPIYGTLFDGIGETTLVEYIDTYFGNHQAESCITLPYVRWRVRNSHKDDILLADQFFLEIQNDWAKPYFLPDSDYLFPYCPQGEKITPNILPFPSQALYLSPAGARTRLHYDGWSSDAMLCQIYGKKLVRMYAPDQAKFLTKPGGKKFGDRFIDIHDYDSIEYPEVAKATPLGTFILEPGDILYIPKFYLHEVIGLTDSVSFTWNFIHHVHISSIIDLLTRNPWQWEVDAIRFFWFERYSVAINSDRRLPGSRSLKAFTSNCTYVDFQKT